MSIEHDSIRVQGDPYHLMDDPKAEPPETSPKSDTETEQYKELLNKLEAWYDQERMIQAVNRYDMALDEDYYDNLQWSDQDRLEVESRGQPALVFNEIKPAVNWVIGTEKRTRVDWNVLPRGKEDKKPAEAKMNLMKYVSDINKVQFARSRAFADAVKAGVGWLEDGARDDPTEEMLFSRYENWRYITYDHLSVEPDMSDARYLFRDRYVDLDIATAMFPEHEEHLRQAAFSNVMHMFDDDEIEYQTALYYRTDSQGRPISHSSYSSEVSAMLSNRRSRNKLIEAWYRKPCNCNVLRVTDDYEGTSFEQLNGFDYDDSIDEMKRIVDDGYMTVFSAMQMRMYFAIFIKGHLLQSVKSPYRHNRFPFTPVWGYRRARDNAPYGIIRALRDPQDDLNKRRSKALYILSTKQVIMEEGAVEDEENLREEVAAPDGIIKKKTGKELEIHTDSALSKEHIVLAEQDSEFIRSISGVNSDNQGRKSNVISGKAVIAKQEEGSLLTAELFDNLRFSVQHQGELQLANIEQFMTKRKVFRLLGKKGKYNFTTINDPDLPESDITRSKADFIVDEQDFRETLRLAMFDQLSRMISSLAPEVAVKLLGIAFELAGMPDDVVDRVNEITGYRDPDEEMTPEEEEALVKQQEEQQFMEMIAKRFDIEKLKELIAKNEATMAKSTRDKIEAYIKALEAAQSIVTLPEMTGAADSIIDSAEESATQEVQYNG